MASETEKINCKRKVRYGSDSAAQHALTKINVTKSLGKPRRVYKCSVCAGWHLSSSAKY